MTSLQTTCVCYKYSSIMVSDATKPSTSTLSKVDHWPKPLKVDSHLLSMIMVCSENPEPDHEYTMRLCLPLRPWIVITYLVRKLTGVNCCVLICDLSIHTIASRIVPSVRYLITIIVNHRVPRHQYRCRILTVSTSVATEDYLCSYWPSRVPIHRPNYVIPPRGYVGW